ncbi:hypothetical protein PC123_g15024 [Phytophthora cactorum]|nr:hypothetical protein PC123_g15024 [Phytophthora cactorum]
MGDSEEMRFGAAATLQRRCQPNASTFNRYTTEVSDALVLLAV